MLIDKSLVGTKLGWRSTCKLGEIKDPGGCQKTDSTDAEPREEPREEPRLPRSPRRLHPAARRRPTHNISRPPSLRTPAPRLEAGSHWPVAPISAQIYRLDAILATSSIHDAGAWLIASASHQYLSCSLPPPQHPHPGDGAGRAITGWSSYSKKVYICRTTPASHPHGTKCDPLFMSSRRGGVFLQSHSQPVGGAVG